MKSILYAFLETLSTVKEVALAMRKKYTIIQKILEEHLSSINENTGEIQSLFDYIQELEIRIDRLTQRLEQTQLSQNQPKPIVSSLNQTERKVFLALYTEEIPVSHKEIAVKTNLPLSLIPECISSLISKGIPFQRSFYNHKLFLKLEPQFKEMQAKENVVNLSLQNFIE